MADDIVIPDSALRGMMWAVAFLKAAIINNGGQIDVDLELFKQVFMEENDRTELFFDRSETTVRCSVIRDAETPTIN